MITTQLTDKEIIERIILGEHGLFEILIRRNNPYLYKIGRSYNFTHEDTQDLMQDTFVAAFTNLSKFEYGSGFKTWIIRIMLNCCFKKAQKPAFKNSVRSEIRDDAVPMYANPLFSDTSTTIMNRELNNVIEAALQNVPSDYRLVFSLREMSGLNVAETAEALNISEANVKVRLNRSKSMLRKEIEKSYSANEIYEFNLVYCDKMVSEVMDKIRHLSIS